MKNKKSHQISGNKKSHIQNAYIEYETRVLKIQMKDRIVNVDFSSFGDIDQITDLKLTDDNYLTVMLNKHWFRQIDLNPYIK